MAAEIIIKADVKPCVNQANKICKTEQSERVTTRELPQFLLSIYWNFNALKTHSENKFRMKVLPGELKHNPYGTVLFHYNKFLPPCNSCLLPQVKGDHLGVNKFYSKNCLFVFFVLRCM